MSIFSVFDPTNWLREKTLLALQASVRLVDLANEPDTTPWYRRKILGIAEHLITRLLPIVAFVFCTDEEAAQDKHSRRILKSGSFALGAWCKKWEIANPVEVAMSSIAESRSDEEIEEKSEK